MTSNLTNKNIRVALYARVSTDMQAEEGKSIDAQIAEMREYAERRGWTVTSEFIDAGYSGKSLERPGVQALEEVIREHTCDVVLVHDLSRLSRRLFDTFYFFETLGKADVGFASVTDQDFDFSSPTGRLFLTIMAALNQYYLDQLSMHTRKSKRQRARDGLYNASTPPFGYKHVGDKDTPPIIVEEEAEIVREVFQRYATGQYSYLEIADWISRDAGHKTHSGRNFSKDTIADMLRNPFYMGKVWYRRGERSQDAGEMFPGKQEAIITEEVWELCRRIREKKLSSPRTYQPAYRVYLLNGLVTCDICNRKLRAQTTSTGSYYREVSKWRGFTDCPHSGKGVRIDSIDQQIEAIIRQVELPPGWQEDILAELEEGDDMDVLKNRRHRLIAERRRLKQMKIHGEFDEDEDLYRRELNRVERELNDLPALDDLQSMQISAELIQNLAHTWDVAELVDRRDLLRIIVRDVKVDVAQARLVSVEPYPVYIPLFRKISWLREVDFGVFAPVWSPEIAKALAALRLLPPITSLPESELSPDWPLVTELPEELIGSRITPQLSSWLKVRRKKELPTLPIVEVTYAPIPHLQVDQRKWPDTEVNRVDNFDQLKSGGVAFLWTPFAIQHSPNGLLDLTYKVRQVVAPDGTWAFIDTLPNSMPGHWLYHFFPEAWANDTQQTWDIYRLNQALAEGGFRPDFDRKTYYQPIQLGVIEELALYRSDIPQLRNLPKRVYESRLDALREFIDEKGPDHLVGSEFSLIEVTADRI